MPTQKLFDYLSGMDTNLKIILSSDHDIPIFEIIIDNLKGSGKDQINNIYAMLEDILISNNKNILKSSQGKFKITFNDFNSDPRALYDIEEIRIRVSNLLEKIPYFFYFFHPASILLLAMCSLDYIEKDGYGTFNNDKKDLSKFLLKYFPYMNNLTAEAEFSSEEEDVLSKKVLKVFGLD